MSLLPRSGPAVTRVPRPEPELAAPFRLVPSLWQAGTSLPLGWDIYFWWGPGHCLICRTGWGRGQAVARPAG